MLELFFIFTFFVVFCFSAHKVFVLHYDRIDVSEDIDVSKTSTSKKCTICQSWYFLNKDLTFQPDVSNCCHDVLMMSMKPSGIAILSIHGVNYCCIINRICKSKAMYLLKNTNLSENYLLLSRKKDVDRNYNVWLY